MLINLEYSYVSRANDKVTKNNICKNISVMQYVIQY